MDAPAVVKLGFGQPGQEWYLIVDQAAQRASLIVVAVSGTAANIVVRDVQDLTRRGA
jgi:hypothetical protein